MGRLRHQIFPGATYFVTTKTWQNVAVFQVHEVAEILIGKMLEYRDRGNYRLHEFVVMPNHLHILVTPGPSTSLERAMQLIKGGCSHAIHKLRGTSSPIWQSGFHESRVRDSQDYGAKRDYIYFNPVVAKLVENPQDWRFGSACGRYQLDPIPQGLKPIGISVADVGAKAPTPNSLSRVSGPEGPTPNTFPKIEASGRMVPLPTSATAQGLKPQPPKERA